MPINHPARSIEIESSGIRRVLLALDSLQDMLALEAAVEVAALVRGTLQGLFVEDTELLRLAQLPFVREVASTSAAVRRMELAQLERDLRTQATEARRLLEHTAQRHRLACSFHIERGRLGSVLANRAGFDLVMLGRPQLSVHPARGARSDTTILTVFDGSDSSGRALETAALIAGAAAPLMVLLPAANSPLRQQAEQILAAAHAGQVYFLTVRELTPKQLIEAGRRYHCRLMIIGGAIEQLMPFVQHASCPAVLVR